MPGFTLGNWAGASPELQAELSSVPLLEPNAMTKATQAIHSVAPIVIGIAGAAITGGALGVGPLAVPGVSTAGAAATATSTTAAASTVSVAGVSTGLSTGISMVDTIVSSSLTGAAASAATGGSAASGAQAGAASGAAAAAKSADLFGTINLSNSGGNNVNTDIGATINGWLQDAGTVINSLGGIQQQVSPAPVVQTQTPAMQPNGVMSSGGISTSTVVLLVVGLLAVKVLL